MDMLAMRSGRKRQGATAVEFAIIAPIFFMLMLGIVEFGRAFMTADLLTEAARRACRVATIEGSTSAQIGQAATDFLTSVGISGESVGISINDAPLNTVEAQYMPAYTEMTVVVTIPASSATWVPTGGFVTGTLSGQYTLRRE
jgi:Flp pilus assembly protein TadG